MRLTSYNIQKAFSEPKYSKRGLLLIRMAFFQACKLYNIPPTATQAGLRRRAWRLDGGLED